MTTLTPYPPLPKGEGVIKAALKEDIGDGDITTCSTVAGSAVVRAEIVVKEGGLVAGLWVAMEVFRQVDKRIKFAPKVKDGAKVKKGTVIATLSGPGRGILTGERVALNFLQRLSGIATLTNQFVSKVQGPTSNVKILDTRKTTPGLRALEKYAVRCGGGTNHRMGLYDAVLIKENHIAIAGGINKAVGKMSNVQCPMSNEGRKKIEIETRTLTEVKAAIKARVGRILLDNMDIRTLREAVRLCKKAGIKTEASGGVTLKNVKQVAATGVDFISVGALTHSARALDISLLVLV